MVRVLFPHPYLTTLGRTYYREDALALDWTDSGVYFRFVGQKLTLQFEAPVIDQPLYVQTTIDGRRTRSCICEGQTTVTFELSDCEHRVSCVRITEILDGVPLILSAVELDGNAPSLCEPPALPDRRMLFIGDSITCGYGILTNGKGDGFKTAEQDGAHTYAALTAAYFEAQAQFVCISGRGIARNCDNYQAPLIPAFFEQTTISHPTPWDHTQYQPDIVVVNAGTNDTAGEDAPVDVNVFKSAVASFIHRLREVYPQAQILWVYGMMAEELHDALQATVTALNDAHVHYLKMRSVNEYEDEQGAACHPNLRAHHRCAGVVIDKVAELTGWSK